jgi:1-deoxy-D-xylulose-5-phosphate reductoisomerase
LKNIAILGATGSVGTQALAVIQANPGLYKVSALTAQSNATLLISQALTFLPDLVVIGDENQYQAVKSALAGTAIRVLAGEEALM